MRREDLLRQGHRASIRVHAALLHGVFGALAQLFARLVARLARRKKTNCDTLMAW
jgi:hypothetical protein